MSDVERVMDSAGMRWVAAVLGALVVVVALLWLFQRRLIYLPDRSAPVSDAVEEITFTSNDAEVLTAWRIPATGRPTATVVVFPGNAGNRSARLPLGAALSERGFEVVLTDYRGYGGNPGSPTEDRLVADAVALVDTIAPPVVYLGESLGGGVAASAAVLRPPAAMILRSPFTSLPAVAGVHYPWLPVDVLLWDRFPVEDTVRAMDVPLLVILGTEDRVVPPVLSLLVFEAAGDHARLVSIEGADHNDYALLAGDRVIDEISGFLDDVLHESGAGGQ